MIAFIFFADTIFKIFVYTINKYFRKYFSKVETFKLNMKDFKNTFLRSSLLCVIIITCMHGFAQVNEDKTDSLYAARLMQDNLELYSQIDSLNLLIKQYKGRNTIQGKQVDSLKVVIAQIQADMAMSGTKADTLESQRLRVKQELLSVKQQMLTISTSLEQKLQLLRDQEFQLNDCQIKLREAQSVASLNQAKLEGKIDVNTTKVEAKEREIAYMQESIKEKDRIISEKTNELAAFYRDKSNSLRIVDSLSRTLNARELEFVKVNERLKIIEGQYNDIVAQRAAATNKKKKVRFVQGAALKFYRTPDFQLAPQSSGSTAIYVITNKNAGKIEFDYITGISLSLYDLSKPDGKYTYDAGMFVGFGGSNLFKNFYIAPSFKAFDFFHFMIGMNVAEYQQLQSGFNEGDALPPGMSIPTVKEWKANVFFGMTIDFELLSSIPKKM
jgi:hypothetical protein